MINKHTQNSFASFYRSAPPAKAIRALLFRCEKTTDLINRSRVSPYVRRELASTWWYISSVARYLERKRKQVNCPVTDRDLRYIHLVLIPRLLSQHLTRTGQQLLRAESRALAKEYARIWRPIARMQAHPFVAGRAPEDEWSSAKKT